MTGDFADARADRSLFSLENETAIVTGGAGVLPSFVAKVLLGQGARVALWGRGTNHPVDVAADRLAKETGIDRQDIGAITVDTADPDSTERAYAETEERIGMPTILVNGVGGVGAKDRFVDFDPEAFNEIISMNLMAGLVVPLQVCARKWIDAGQTASVINMASMASYRALSGVWAYDAAKSATKNLTEGVAGELAEFGIRVNAIAPGFFLGHQNRRLLVADDESGEFTARGQAIIDRTPFGRFGKLEDIEGAILYLASTRASGFVTGVTIPVDGGFLTHNI